MIFGAHGRCSNRLRPGSILRRARARTRSTIVTEIGVDPSADRRVAGQGGEAGRGHRGAHVRRGSERRGAVRTAGRASPRAKRSARSRPRRSSSRCRRPTRRCGRGRCRRGSAALIASTAADDPSVERSLLRAAAKGHVALRDKCIAVRAEREDQAERSKRQHAARSFAMWPTPDGMVEGHFKVTPEVGGAIKAVIEDGTRKRFRDARSDGRGRGRTRTPRTRSRTR